MKTNIILLLFAFVLASSCKEKPSKITKTSDYEIYITNPDNTILSKIEEDYSFWKNKYMDGQSVHF